MGAGIEDVLILITDDDLSSLVRQTNNELDRELATSVFQFHNIDKLPHDSLDSLPRHE